MNPPTHWMPDCLSPDEWPADHADTPEKAAQMLLEFDQRVNDDTWEAWNDMQKEGRVTIHVRGYLHTTEPIENEEEQFDGYEPGCEWLKATDEVRVVMVKLSYEVMK